MDRATFPIRVFKQLGVDTVVCEYLFIFDKLLRTIRVIRDK